MLQHLMTASALFPLSLAFQKGVLNAASRDLVEHAIRDRNTQDNVSVVTIRLSSQPCLGQTEVLSYSTTGKYPSSVPPILSTNSFLLGPEGFVDATENALVIPSGNTSGEGGLDVDALLRELDNLDSSVSDHARASQHQPPPSQPQQPPPKPQQQGTGAGAEGSREVLGDDPELMDYLLNPANFTKT